MYVSWYVLQCVSVRIAVRKCTEIIKNVQTVIAIEMMSAAQAFEFHEGRRPGKGTTVAYEVIREVVPKLVDDRVLYPDIEKIRRLVVGNKIVDPVEAKIGPLTTASDIDL